jgi:translation initiation factor IF-2
MPSKSTSPSSDKNKDNTKPANAEPKKVLSLIDGEGPKTKSKMTAPRKESSLLQPLGARKIAAKSKTATAQEEPKKTLDESKKEALNLFDIKPKEKVRRKSEDLQSATLFKPISKIVDPVNPPVTEVQLAVQKAAQRPTEELSAKFITSDSGEKIIHLKPPIIVKDLADRMGLKPFKVIADLIALKVFVANADKSIEIEVAEKICEKHGFKLEREKREKGAGIHKIEDVVIEPPAPKKEEIQEDNLVLRAPIITFMGHVDHGKTSLLDAIRKTTVVTGEAGGITQHIGAYSVFHNGKPVTFIDTPGHAAFSSMRARGANVTDIVVLIIAADDGIMPQTREALSHAKAAGVTIMIAINKCDLPAANVMRVKTQLQEAGMATVDWGGEIECMEVSAKSGLGLNEFLETMALQAEVMDLKADPKANPRCTIIESSMQAGKGAAATVIVRQGSLKVGQSFICGPHWGKVKALVDDQGKPISEVLPGMPAEVIGFSDMPHVGDELVVMESERSVKKLSEERLDENRLKKLKSSKRASTLENLFSSIEEGSKKALKLIVKADVQGSVEALVKCLQDIKSSKINLDILHSDVGSITESDVILASASDAVVIGFNVKVENKALTSAKRESVQVKLYSIIYELIDQVKESMAGLLDPLTREKVIGHAKVKQVFKVTKGWVGGSVVTDGVINRKQRARVLRDGQAVYDGSIETLRRFHDEVPEVKNGLECGIRLSGFSDYEEGDVIECYELEKIKQTL